MVWKYLTAAQDSRIKEREKIVKLQKMWALRKPVLDAHISILKKKVADLEYELDSFVIEQKLFRAAAEEIRPPPFQQHNASGGGCQGRRSRYLVLGIRPWRCYSGIRSAK